MNTTSLTTPIVQHIERLLSLSGDSDVQFTDEGSHVVLAASTATFHIWPYPIPRRGVCYCVDVLTNHSFASASSTFGPPPPDVVHHRVTHVHTMIVFAPPDVLRVFLDAVIFPTPV